MFFSLERNLSRTKSAPEIVLYHLSSGQPHASSDALNLSTHPHCEHRSNLAPGWSRCSHFLQMDSLRSFSCWSTGLTPFRKIAEAESRMLFAMFDTPGFLLFSLFMPGLLLAFLSGTRLGPLLRPVIIYSNGLPLLPHISVCI